MIETIKERIGVGLKYKQKLRNGELRNQCCPNCGAWVPQDYNWCHSKTKEEIGIKRSVDMASVVSCPECDQMAAVIDLREYEDDSEN